MFYTNGKGLAWLHRLSKNATYTCTPVRVIAELGKSAFLDRLSEVDLDVVAITDHNSVDVKLLEAVHDRIAPQGKHLFAGVELNVKLKDKTIDDYKLKVAEGHDVYLEDVQNQLASLPTYGELPRCPLLETGRA